MHYCRCGTLSCAFFKCQIFLFFKFLFTVKSRFYFQSASYMMGWAQAFPNIGLCEVTLEFSRTNWCQQLQRVSGLAGGE